MENKYLAKGWPDLFNNMMVLTAFEGSSEVSGELR